jgi:hypothetical protein
MRSIKGSWTAALTGTVIVALSGCATTAQQESTTSPPVSSHTATSAATFSPEAGSQPTTEAAQVRPALEIANETSVSNEDGYTLDLVLRWSSTQGFVADPTNAKPGQTDSTITTDDVLFSVRNTTPSRAAKGLGIGLYPVALYPMSLGLCDTDATFSPNIIGNGQANRITTPSGTYCLARLGVSYGLLSVNIPLGAEVSKSELMGGKLAAIEGLDEASPIVAELNKPAFVGTILGSQWATTAGCDVTVSSINPAVNNSYTLLVTGENLKACG